MRNLEVDGFLNAVPPVVDHGHDVGEVQTLYHHLHEVLVAASACHKLLQGKLTCERGEIEFGDALE